MFQGDALITTCTYDTEKRDNITLGGYAIKDEMCVNYVHYYPKIQLEVCKSSISDRSVLSEVDRLHTQVEQAKRDAEMATQIGDTLRKEVIICEDKLLT